MKKKPSLQKKNNIKKQQKFNKMESLRVLITNTYTIN